MKKRKSSPQLLASNANDTRNGEKMRFSLFIMAACLSSGAEAFVPVKAVRPAKHTHLFQRAARSREFRPTLEDVERLSRGDAAKRRGTGSRAVCHRLNSSERDEWNLAKARGFVILRGTGYRKERKGSPLCNIFRQFSDARAAPYISIQQGLGIDGRDEVFIDFSTLRQKGEPVLELMDEVTRQCLSMGASIGEESHDDAKKALSFVSEDQFLKEPIWAIPPVRISFLIASRKEAKLMCVELLRILHEQKQK